MEVQWSKADDGSWCLLDQVEPWQLDGHGVFVIWRSGTSAEVSAVLYVGRGLLKDAFARCRHEPALRSAGLHVTWATIHDVRMLDGVAVYLCRHLRPIWGQALPVVPPMPVNLPLRALG